MVPIIGVDAAIAAKSLFDVPVTPCLTLIEVGDADAAMAASARVFQGHITAGGQNHFVSHPPPPSEIIATRQPSVAKLILRVFPSQYMETQTATARPRDGNSIEVICGSQAPSSYQVPSFPSLVSSWSAPHPPPSLPARHPLPAF